MRALLLLLAALWSPYVAAQAAPSVTYGVNGGTLVPGTLSDVGSGYRTWSNNDSMPGGARISDKHNVRFGPSANADLFSNRRVPWSGVSKALRWAGTAGLVYGAGTAIYDAWQAAALQPNGSGFDLVTNAQVVAPSLVFSPAGNPSIEAAGWYTSRDAALAAGSRVYAQNIAEIIGVGTQYVSHTPSRWQNGDIVPGVVNWVKWGSPGQSPINVGLRSRTDSVTQCADAGTGQLTGTAATGGLCPGAARPATEAEVDAALNAAAASGAVRGGDVLREAVGQGYVVPLSDTQPLPATGPSSVSSPSRTVVTTAPDGSTSAQSVPGPVYNITYNTNSYTYNVTNTSPTPDGGTVSETGEPLPSCGLPGQPACQVKVDESGTPSATSPDLSVFESLKTQDAQKVSEALSSVPEPSFGFIGAPPIVACRPVPLPNEMGEIDACNVVDTVRELMGFLWALAAAWISLGWIREAVNGG